MSRFNKIILIGTVSNSPELKQTSSGDSVCSFILDVERPMGESSVASSDRFTINCWRDLADTASAFTSGSTLIVDGSIRNRSYENDSGQRIYVTEIEAKSIKQLSAQTQSASLDSSASIPVVEEQPKQDKAFDFNEAIKSEETQEFATQLGEDVPF